MKWIVELTDEGGKVVAESRSMELEVMQSAGVDLSAEPASMLIEPGWAEGTTYILPKPAPGKYDLSARTFDPIVHAYSAPVLVE